MTDNAKPASAGTGETAGSAVYEIKTIDDFLRLPDRAIDKALAEFVPAMKAAHAMYRLAVTLAEVAGVAPDTVPMTIPTMRFVDDDRKTITFNLKPNAAPHLRGGAPAEPRKGGGACSA